MTIIHSFRRPDFSTALLDSSTLHWQFPLSSIMESPHSAFPKAGKGLSTDNSEVHKSSPLGQTIRK